MVARRYFDRTPGYEGDEVEITRIINNYVGDGLTPSEVQALIRAELDDIQLDAPPERQIIATASGTVAIDLLQGRTVFVLATAGSWTPSFVNRPTGVAKVWVVVDVTTDDHAMTLPSGFSWEGTAPVTADFDAGKRYIFEFVVLPDGTGVAQWLGSAVDTPDPDPVLTPPTLAGFYSTSASRTSPTALDAATLPAGEVVVFFTTTDDAIVSQLRVFYNHTGSLPAVGAESSVTSWVGNRTAPPFSLLGNQAGSATLSQFWDTNVDPTGNANPEHDANGENTITIDAVLTDGTVTTPVTFTFDTANAAPGSDAVLTDTLTGYSLATSSHNVTIPDAVDRLVVVTAHYRVSPDASRSMVLDSLSLGGTAMTEVTDATNDPAITDGAGVFVAYASEADLTTGTMTLTPTFSSTVSTTSSIVYHVAVLSNVASPVVRADDDFDNVSPTTSVTGEVTLTSVAANSILLTSMSQASTTAADQTVSIGTPGTAVTSAGLHKVRSATLMDSGASANETATWSGTGRATTVLVAVEYSASSGGSPTPDVTPGTPVISSVTAANNQLTVTWGAASDAVDYQIRWGTTNPPARTPLSVGNVLTYTITGLAASVLQYVQVRAVSSTSTAGAWSTVRSESPKGEVTPPQSFPGRFPTTTSAYEASMSEGNQSPDMGDIVIPSPYRRINIGQTEAAMASAVKAGIDLAVGRDLFISRWQNHANRTDYHMATGPRLIITGRLAFNSTWSPHLRWNENPAYSINAVLSMAKSASKGRINHNWIWHQVGDDLNRSVSVGGQSYRLADHVFMSISHEPNPWSSNYWGTVTNLIGRSEMNVSALDYGSDVKAAMDIVRNTGNLAPLHKLAATNAIEQIRSRCPDAICGFSPAESGDSVPVGTPANNLSNVWPSEAFPDAGVLDFLTPTDYPFRGKGSLTFTGGDANNPANWVHDGGGFIDNSLAFADALGCAYGLLEYSGSYNLPGESPAPGVDGWYSDAEVRMIHRRFFEVDLPSATNGLAFVNHWLFPTWDQSKADAGKSWIVLEGCWGRAPDGFRFSSTSRPSWSTVSQNEGNLWYQQTLDWFRETFPR